MKAKYYLLTAGLLFCSMKQLHGQALNSTQRIEGPFSGVVGCTDKIALSGTIYNTIHMTRSDKDSTIMVVIQGGPKEGAQAINMTTGERYNIVGHTMSRLQFSQNILEKFSYTNNFNVVGLYKVHYTYHVNIIGDSYDNVTAFIDNLRVTCKE